MRDYGLSAGQEDEVWRQWRAGEPLSVIARSVGVPVHHVRRFLAQTGGVRQPSVRRRNLHLSLTEREEISHGLAAGCSARAIARRLSRPSSTISREISRNGGRVDYRAAAADVQAYRRARRPKMTKLAQDSRLRTLVEQKLTMRWSPEQIAGWLPLGFPDDPGMRISHEAIYLSLFDPRRRKAIDRGLTQQLRSGCDLTPVVRSG
ncbi:helix-turn-helix domain-containing protein [Nocardia amamiensis]